MSYKKREPFLIFGAPHIEEDEIEEVVTTLRSGWIGKGPKTAQFEKEFAAYSGSDHALGLSSCTAALHLALVTLGIGAGDEVIVPAMTFCATANAVIHAGAIPILVDVEQDTFNMDPEQVRRKISPRTKAIVPVHFAGRACRMDALAALAREHDLRIIEDCAHAIE